MKKVKIPNIPFGPFPTAIVGTAVDGKPNFVTIGACGVVCQKPVLYISLKNSHYSTQGIQEQNCFSLNIPSAALVKKTDYCGIASGNSTDKSGVFSVFYDDAAAAPLIEDCAMNFLCRVVQKIPVYDFTMFLGEIVAAYVSDGCITGGKPDPLKIDPLILMGTSYFNLKSPVGSAFQEGRNL